MGDFIETILRKLENGTGAELVSVVEASGSTPRGAGALLAVFGDSTATGTVGGGNVEFEATNLARELVAQGENALRHFRFVQGDAASLGMVCGGDVTLHFQYLSPADEKMLKLLRDLLEACRQNTDRWCGGWRARQSPSWPWRDARASMMKDPSGRTCCRIRRSGGTDGSPCLW